MTQEIQATNIVLESRHARLVFAPLEQGGYGLGLDVRDGETWRSICAPINPLVRGPSFNLFPHSLEAQPDGSLLARGTARATAQTGAPLEYAFETRIRVHAHGWFEVDTTLVLPEALELQMRGGFEPEITLDMGALPPYDRGDHVWFKTSIQNPTKWNDEAYGNDCPALYYFDAYSSYELMMFFDMTVMTWMGRENIARFLNYRCGFRRRYKPGPMFELGLYADGFSGTSFPAGPQRFRSYITARARADAPTEPQAVTTLMGRCLELVPRETTWPQNATGWREFAEGCATDLMDPQCWNRSSEFEDFILNYVNGYSPAWYEAFEAKHQPIDFKNSPCIDSALYLDFPLAVTARLTGDPRYVALHARVLAFVRAYFDSEQSFLHATHGATGTWQFIYNLEQTWWAAKLNRDETLMARVLETVNREVIPLAHNVEHLFPLSFERRTLRRTGNGDAYGVAGVYAALMLHLFEATGLETYLTEAKRSVRVLPNLPVNSLNQEVFLNSLGAQAAAKLARITGEVEYLETYRYLLAQVLRQMYWFDDKTRDDYSAYNTFAMFQACTPIIYPAFFENIEPLARIASTFGTIAPSLGLLRVYNHARKNNFYMFPRCLPKNHHTSNLEFIPFENVGVLEDEKTGYIGQEIYGTGQVFQAYLMWEAFAHSDHRDVMVVNMDNYKFLDLERVTSSDLHFVVFNPEGTRISSTLSIPTLKANDQVFAGPSLETLELQTSLRLELERDEIRYLHLKRA